MTRKVTTDHCGLEELLLFSAWWFLPSGQGSCGPGVWTAPVKKASMFRFPFCVDQSTHSYGGSTHAADFSWEVSVVARTPEGCVIILRSLKPHLIETSETTSGPTWRSLCLLEKTQD